MSDLHQMKCVVCRAGEPIITDGEIYMLHPQIPGWQVKEVGEEKWLERVFKFKNFAQALGFTNKIGGIAEEEDHHPIDLRFLSDILNRQVKVNTFRDFRLSPTLPKGDVPNVCDSWLPVRGLVDSQDWQFTQKRFHHGCEDGRTLSVVLWKKNQYSAIY